MVRELEARYAGKGQAELFTALRPCLLTTEGNCPAAKIARHPGMTEQALRMKLHRLRKRYAGTLRRTVRATPGREAEIHHLMSVFA